MRYKFLFILIIFICSLFKTVYASNPICELTGYICSKVNYEDLVKVGNLYHEKFSDEPFTGEVIGTLKGFMKKGIRDGRWTCFDEGGKIRQKIIFSMGYKDGLTEIYNKKGELVYKVQFEKETILKNSQMTLRNGNVYKLEPLTEEDKNNPIVLSIHRSLQEYKNEIKKRSCKEFSENLYFN